MATTPFSVLGWTPTGDHVVGGLFYLYDTLGVPFEVVFDECRRHRVMPAWRDLYREARQAGWTRARTLARLDESVGDVYGGEFRDVVIHRLREQFPAGA